MVFTIRRPTEGLRWIQVVLQLICLGRHIKGRAREHCASVPSTAGRSPTADEEATRVELEYILRSMRFEMRVLAYQ